VAESARSFVRTQAKRAQVGEDRAAEDRAEFVSGSGGEGRIRGALQSAPNGDLPRATGARGGQVVAAWMMGIRACAGMALGAPRLAASALKDPRRTMMEDPLRARQPSCFCILILARVGRLAPAPCSSNGQSPSCPSGPAESVGIDHSLTGGRGRRRRKEKITS
jgi:hypothetical protein